MTTAPSPAPVRRRGAFHLLRVASVDRLTDDAVAVGFAVPPGLVDDYAFDAGQWLTLRRVVDGVEHRRSYSICAPAGSAPRIGVREVADGLFSRWLTREVRVGDEVEVATPAGAFRVAAGTGGRHLCVAAGSGITPVLAIAATVLADPDARVTLVYGNRTSGTVMFAEELADLKDRHGPRLQLVHVLSREPRDVELFSGRLDGERLRRLLPVLVPLAAVDHAWVCGPHGLAEDAREVLGELGVDPARVHVELFHVDGPPPAPRRADTAYDGPGAAGAGLGSEVSVLLDGRTTTVTVARDTTVLDGAATVRADLPFACRGGVCGTCRARVELGEVDMRRNYALDADEVAAGFVLTCQSYPVTDLVSLDLDA